MGRAFMDRADGLCRMGLILFLKWGGHSLVLGVSLILLVAGINPQAFLGPYGNLPNCTQISHNAYKPKNRLLHTKRPKGMR